MQAEQCSGCDEAPRVSWGLFRRVEGSSVPVFVIRDIGCGQRWLGKGGEALTFSAWPACRRIRLALRFYSQWVTENLSVIITVGPLRLDASRSLAAFSPSQGWMALSLVGWLSQPA